MNIQRDEPSAKRKCPSKTSLTAAEEETEQQEMLCETVLGQEPPRSPKKAKAPQRYDELKIKGGPIYNLTKPEESNEKDSDATSSAASLPPEDDAHVTSRVPAPLLAESTALLIVDVQPEYWSHCPAVRRDFPAFPARLRRTLDVCRRRRAKVVWVRADYRRAHSPWLAQFARLRGRRDLGEVPCDPSSPAFAWEDFATPAGGEVVVAKASWSSTSNTALTDVLRAACVDTVLVCGLLTSVCVQHSAFGLFEAGHRVLLVADACADRGRARHDAALALYGDYMYELVASEDLASETTGLVPAEPLWIVLDDNNNMVNSFPRQPIAPCISTNTVSTCSTNTVTNPGEIIGSCASPSANIGNQEMNIM